MDSRDAPVGRFTYRRPGLVCTDHTLAVPLDHAPGEPLVGGVARKVGRVLV